ncbi:hypothetical protein [Marinicella rhabdoformis]|uniref:hypothetical protein n=1 Tax=Marinicella rhabdoformis TaxID=2580566 RepID=UPI0012AEDB73|nr:hypothetical protein [Marinicella rhabdoformis]
MNKRNLKVLLAFVLLIFTSFWLKQNEEKTLTKQVNTPNTVTQKPAFDLEKFEKEAKEKQSQNDTRFRDNWFKQLAGKIPKPLNKTPTFLQAYRDYRYFNRCEQIIAAIDAGSPAYAFAIPGFQANKFDVLSDLQKLNFEKRVGKCQHLAHAFIDLPYSTQISIRLQQRYQSIQPKTDEEKALESILKQITEFKHTSGLLNNLKRGERIDHNLFFDLNNQRNALRKEYPQRTLLFGGYSEADQDLVAKLDAQMADLDKQIAANTYYDHEQINHQQSNKDTIAQQLIQNYYKTPYPDTLLAMYDLFNNDSHKVAFNAYEKQYGKTILPEEYGMWLEQAVTNFRACELGYPCGPESELTETLCLEFMNPDATKACDQAVTTHYIDNLLSENQLLDVETLLKEWF